MKLYRTVGRKYGRPTWKADFEAAVHRKTQTVLALKASAAAAVARGVLTHRTRELGRARPKGYVPPSGPRSRISVGKGEVSDWYVRLEAGSARRALYIEGAIGPLRAAAGHLGGWAYTGSHPGDAFGNRRHGLSISTRSRLRGKRRRRRQYRFLYRRGKG